MGTVRKRGTGWRAQIARRGVRESRTFDTKQEAQDWIAVREGAILDGALTAYSRYTLADLCDKYEESVTVNRRDPRAESIRLARMRRWSMAAESVTALTAEKISTWRDERMQAVKPGTVLREMVLLRSVLEHGRRDLGWIAVNPIADVRKPATPPARTRTISDAERDAMLTQLGYAGGRVETVGHEVAVALLLALETAMRAGEIVGLEWPRVDLDRRVAHLPMTKNGYARDVPLIGDSVALLRKMKGRRLLHVRVKPDPARVFHIDARSLDTLFRRARMNAGLQGFTFHDSRATALTRLARMVDVLTLAKISGHRDIKQLRDYYRETAEQIAARLA